MGATGEKQASNQPLRSGYTTGACATAAAVAAVKKCFSEDCDGPVRIIFPDQKWRDLPVAGVELLADGAARAWIVKDAGDDPDITHGATIEVRVKRVDADIIEDADFLIECGNARLIVRGGSGVGMVERRALPVPVGKWAINPVPRHMLSENLGLTSLPTVSRNEDWLVEIRIEDGEQLARKTLNPVLGIVGGLSVLGTSGIVIPCSNSAYVETIRALFKGVVEAEVEPVYLVTGGRTADVIVRTCPDVPELAIIRIGDFIRESVDMAAEYGIRRVNVVCMPGKLAKYAQGMVCTHAHKKPQSLPRVADILAQNGLAGEVVADCQQSRSMREFLDKQTVSVYKSVLQILREQALQYFRDWIKDRDIEFSLIVVDQENIVCID
ncbi:MAG: cobalt-precorrin-5B (C(1))-methyltransferase CbiD [Lentisphaeria bacterium]